MTRKEALRESAKVIAWGVALYGAVQFIGTSLAQNRAGAVIVQAVVAEWGAGRLAVAWTDPKADMPTPKSIATRAGKGAAMGAAAAVFVVAFALLSRAATRAPNVPVVSDLALGLFMAALIAMKDELLLRGLVLRAFHHTAPKPVALVICGLAAAAAQYGAVTASAAPDAYPLAQALVAGIGGVAFAALWQKDRGAWVAWGAHAAWLWVTGSVIRGGLIDVRWVGGHWGGADAGAEASLAVAVALTAVAAAAIAWAYRQKTPPHRAA